MNRFYGEEIKLIDLLGGKQTYVYYTIRGDTNVIGMFEVLINEKLEDSKQLVIDYGELVLNQDANNFGRVHLGGGDGKVLIFFDTFSTIIGYTMCDYKSIVSEEGAVSCIALDK